MSTKLTNPDESQADVKSGSTNGSWQTPEPVNTAPQKHGVGKIAMTAEVMADLLARLMDIQALWTGADSMVMAEQSVLLVAFPLSDLRVGKITSGHGKEIYTVNDAPVVMAEDK